MLIAVSRLYFLIFFKKSVLTRTSKYEKPVPPKLFILVPKVLASDLDYGNVTRGLPWWLRL